jgi:hypothetical protein
VAVLIRPRRWGQTKPGPGATIDWGHPLAQRMEFFAPLTAAQLEQMVQEASSAT